MIFQNKTNDKIIIFSKYLNVKTRYNTRQLTPPWAPLGKAMGSEGKSFLSKESFSPPPSPTLPQSFWLPIIHCSDWKYLGDHHSLHNLDQNNFFEASICDLCNVEHIKLTHSTCPSQDQQFNGIPGKYGLTHMHQMFHNVVELHITYFNISSRISDYLRHSHCDIMFYNTFSTSQFC